MLISFIVYDKLSNYQLNKQSFPGPANICYWSFIRKIAKSRFPAEVIYEEC